MRSEMLLDLIPNNALSGPSEAIQYNTTYFVYFEHVVFQVYNIIFTIHD